MTDLLMRLAERTLGTAPTARPVIASMFESVPTSGSSLSTPQPAFSDREEIVETDAHESPARANAGMTRISTRPASGIMDQPLVAPVSSITMTASAATQTHTRIAPRQAESAEVSGIETRQDDIVSLPREHAIRLTPAKETISSALEELRQTRHAPRIPIIPGHPAEASTPIVHVKSGEGPLPGKAQPIDQTFPPEIYEQPVARAVVEQGRATDTFPMAHQQGQPRRGAEPTSFLVQKPRQEITPAQHTIYEVRELETAPALPSQQQGRRPSDGSIAQEPDHTRRLNESSAAQGNQFTLVPTRSPSQSIEQAPANQQSERGTENRSPRQAVSQQSRQIGDSHIVEKAVLGTEEAQAEVPTIRVTIGRIDVRAVTPATPTTRAKPTRTGPAVSLEEYTRQNKGGR